MRTDLPALAPPPGFVERAAALGIAFETGDLDRLGRYLAMLLDTNTAINLTGITDAAEAWDKHILDALTVLSVLSDLPDGAAVLDVGTGGGIPGVPVAICAPRLRLTLLDATRKKTLFLERVIGALGLSNAAVLTGRAESLGHQLGGRSAAGRVGGHRQAYDAVLARAVGRLATLAELTVPFATIGGLCVLIKGGRADEELAEAKQALHLLHAAHAGTVPTPTGRIVVLEKLRATPRDYPRREGEPKRAPLGTKPPARA